MKPFSLARDLAAEQRAFLRRNRSRWQEHLDRVRAFLGEGLASADPGAPVLILGAGSGLEVPWRLAPASAVGWDGDPWSRIRTLCRHRRWAPWVFQDLTGGMAALSALAWRTARQPGSERVRTSPAARRRLVGLLGTLDPRPAPLQAWIQAHRPGTILAANVMGQFGVGAQRAVERAFGGHAPWSPDINEGGPPGRCAPASSPLVLPHVVHGQSPGTTSDPDLPDPLEEALDAWTARAVRAFLGALAASGADLWLVHDRGVLFGAAPLDLGPMEEPWAAQVRCAVPVEASDPLCGVDVLREIQGRSFDHHQRWLWPVAPGQTQVVEAVRIRPTRAAFLSHNPD